jgi:hypothetical protein
VDLAFSVNSEPESPVARVFDLDGLAFEEELSHVGVVAVSDGEGYSADLGAFTVRFAE